MLCFKSLGFAASGATRFGLLVELWSSHTKRHFFWIERVESCKVAMHLFLVASLFLVVRPGAPSSFLAPSSDALSS